MALLFRVWPVAGPGAGRGAPRSAQSVGSRVAGRARATWTRHGRRETGVIPGLMRRLIAWSYVPPELNPREAAMSTIEDRVSGELREGYAEIGDQRLHYVEAGDGPLIVLLHGFPEFWYGWRQQIEPLAAAGFRVVAPDIRGYNLSSKPDGVAAYDVGQLADDIQGLIGERGAETAMLVGHD